MNNIFEGAEFGDKFKLVKSIGVLVGDHRLYIKGYGEEFYNDKGIALVSNESIKGLYDIVSKYHKQIDEDKLDELAEKGFSNYLRLSTWHTVGGYRDGFKEGYRKAMEE